MTLTKLQRIGISTLICGIRDHGCPWLKCGFIKFTNNRVAQWCVMFIHTIDVNKKEIIYQMTLEYNENIDDKIEYEFEFDRFTQMYAITERGYAS